MSDDDWKGEARLKGIKRPKGEGNGYNLKRHSLEARIEDSRLKGSQKMSEVTCRCGWAGLFRELKGNGQDEIFCPKCGRKSEKLSGMNLSKGMTMTGELELVKEAQRRGGRV